MFVMSLLRANHKDNIWKGIKVKRGQFITGLDSFATETETTPKKVRLFWKKFETIGFMARKRTNKYSIVTICNYDRYQTPVNYKGQAKGQTEGKQRATDNNDKKVNKEYIEACKGVILYLNAKAGKAFRVDSDSNRELITARLKERFTIEDLKAVVDNKVMAWKGSSMNQYLRPATLFSKSKFESYLNEKSQKRYI